MKILIDNQIFEQQKFGGISRYFHMLESDSDTIVKMEPFRKKVGKKSFYQKLRSKLNTTLSNSAPPNKYDFYRSQINKSEFDIFHPTYYDPYFIECLNKPFVLTVYDMIHEKYPEYFGGSPDSFNKHKLCGLAEKIIAISYSTKKDLIDIYNIPEEKIEVVHLATDYDSIKPVKPNSLYTKQPYIIFTGNRGIYKNFLTFLIGIAPILKEKKDLILICTGPEFNVIEKKWIKELVLEAKVMQYYCGNDEELVYLYENAECFVFPSLYEGFGFPLLEAFACGCPVVSSYGGSLKEIGGDAAVYFDPKDILKMRTAVQEVLSDNSLRKELILKGRERLKDFSWEKCRKETNQVYEKLI